MIRAASAGISLLKIMFFFTRGTRPCSQNAAKKANHYYTNDNFTSQ